MPSQFSTIGFDVSSGEDLAALASRVADRAETIHARNGTYLKWAPPSGEQLWLQLTPNGDAMGMTPHFAGPASMRVAIDARVTRQGHTPLDGTFIAWANPPDDGEGGEYPFAFDCPDAGTYGDLTFPVRVTMQIAAFAQQLTVHASPEAYRAASAAQGLAFASQSFIPSGLFRPGGEAIDPPEPHALFVGHVIEGAARRNAVTGRPFWWALVETLGGTIDVVVHPDLVPEPPSAGQVVSGWFWLSGRIQRDTPARPSRWWHRMAGR